MKRTFPKLAMAAAIGCLSLGLAAPAIAQDDGSAAETEEQRHAGLKHRCQAAIDQRLDHLAVAQAKVQRADALTVRHEAAIDDIIDRSQSGLTLLSAQIEAASDPSVVVGLCAQIAPDFRVYLVVLPQTHLTVAADRSQAAADGGVVALVTLDEAIARAADAGADVTAAQGFRDDAAGHLAAADAANDGVADAVLGVTPAGYNDGDGAAVLNRSRGQLRTTQEELRGAHQSAAAAVQALRDAVGALN